MGRDALPPVSPRPPVCWLCKGRGYTTVAVIAPDSTEGGGGPDPRGDPPRGFTSW